MRLKAPVGTRLEVTEELTRQALKEIKNILGPDSVKISVAHIGQTAPTFTANAVFLWTSGPDQAVIRIALNEKKGFRTEEVKERLRNELPERLKPWLAKQLLTDYGVAARRRPEAGRASGRLLRAGRRDQPGHELRFADADRGGHQRPQPGGQPRHMPTRFAPRCARFRPCATCSSASRSTIRASRWTSTANGPAWPA